MNKNKLIFALLFLCFTCISFAQNAHVKGIILDNENHPVSNVNITSGKNNTQSDVNGFFDIEVISNKKASFKLNFTDVLNTNNFYINSAVGQTAINKRYNLDNRIATLAFTYRI